LREILIINGNCFPAQCNADTVLCVLWETGIRFQKLFRRPSYFKSLDREVHLNNIQELLPAMHETISVTKLSGLIMRETVVVYCDNEKKYVNKACRRYAVLLKLEVEWTYVAAAA
jgi:hypothetical protein